MLGLTVCPVKMCSLNRQVVQARKERKQDSRDSDESGEMRLSGPLEPFKCEKVPLSEHK